MARPRLLRPKGKPVNLYLAQDLVTNGRRIAKVRYGESLSELVTRLLRKEVVLKLGGLKEGEGVEDVGVGLTVKPEQLGEMRELYKSAVTDDIPGLEEVSGHKFVAAAREWLANPPPSITEARKAHLQRFLDVYAQLF